MTNFSIDCMLDGANRIQIGRVCRLDLMRRCFWDGLLGCTRSLMEVCFGGIDRAVCVYRIEINFLVYKYVRIWML